MEKLVISRKQLAADYEELSIKQIMNKYGICNQRLYDLLDECNIPRKRIREKRSPSKDIILKD
jgi:hypothetical protein